MNATKLVSPVTRMIRPRRRKNPTVRPIQRDDVFHAELDGMYGLARFLGHRPGCRSWEFHAAFLVEQGHPVSLNWRQCAYDHEIKIGQYVGSLKATNAEAPAA